LRELPHHGVLASTTADDKNLHLNPLVMGDELEIKKEWKTIAAKTFSTPWFN
jgi:hypothetical protein